MAIVADVRRITWLFGWAAAVILTLGTGRATAQPAAPYPQERIGHFPTHGAFSVFPWERIDTFSGNVTLTIPLLSRPGHAGGALTVAAVWQSKDERLRVAIPGPLTVTTWKPAAIPSGHAPNPLIVTGDGGEQRAFESATGSGVWTTATYWRWEPGATPPRVLTPDGLAYEFGDVTETAATTTRTLTRIVDAFGNTTDVSMSTAAGRAPRLEAVTQHVGAQTRTVQWTYTTSGSVETVSDLATGQTWTFSIGASGLLITPPEGAAWVIGPSCATGCAGLERGLRVTTPHGGWVEYILDVIQGPFDAQGYPTWSTPMVVRRVAGNRGQATGDVWSLDYHGASGMWTTVIGPGRSTTYRHTGTRDTYLESVTTDGPDGGQEVTQYTWQPMLAVGLEDPFFSYNYPDEFDRWPSPYPWRVAEVTTTRDGKAVGTLTLTYNPGSLGFPDMIVETGDYDRRTTYTYRHFQVPYILGRTASAVVFNAAGEQYQRTYTYDGSGFLTGQTIHGLTTTFTPDAYGNVATQTNGRSLTTSYTYDWGAVQSIRTPAYPSQLTVSRAINPSGTIASETHGALTTAFTYDRTTASIANGNGCRRRAPRG
jgi:hypothetical protein